MIVKIPLEALPLKEDCGDKHCPSCAGFNRAIKAMSTGVDVSVDKLIFVIFKELKIHTYTSQVSGSDLE